MEDIENVTVNYEKLINRSLSEVDPKLYERYVTNKAIDEPAYTILAVMYSLLILLGGLGNTLVIITVMRKASMRTPRNMFIFNLAVADLLLCTVTMPLTLMEILTKYFPLGNYRFVCKLIGTLQATSTYVSTLSITAIALDRYQVIVYPTKESLHLFGAVSILSSIWIIAILLASPLFFIRHLTHHELQMNGNVMLSIDFCIENWPVEHGRAYYSIFSLIFQYLLPILIVSCSHLRIAHKLKRRFQGVLVSTDENNQKNRRQLRGRRLHRTNILLGSIAAAFCISWLPLNLFNVIADLSTNTNHFTSQAMMVVYAICHMFGMSSACTNPILYGVYNENFYKEFKHILCFKKRSDDVVHTTHKISIRKRSEKFSSRSKPDLVTGATTEYQQCHTVSTDMTVLTKC